MKNSGNIHDSLKLYDLDQELKNLNVPKNYYSLGNSRNERMCLIEHQGQWLVFYSEHGQMADLHKFNNFEDARNYFINVFKS